MWDFVYVSEVWIVCVLVCKSGYVERILRLGLRLLFFYQRNKIRNARVKGLAYVNYENVLVAEKAKPLRITCKCPRKCYLK